MKEMKSIFITMVVLLGLASNCFSQTDLNTNEKLKFDFAGNIGWGAPYGFGFEAGYLIIPSLNLNPGLGLSMSGFKIGIGSQYFFRSDMKFSPYAGINISHNGGLGKLNVNVNQDSAVYKIAAGNTFYLRTGFRYAFSFANFYTNIGYGILLSGGKAEYVSGSNDETVESLAKLLEPKGLEVSIGLKFRLWKQ